MKAGRKWLRAPSPGRGTTSPAIGLGAMLLRGCLVSAFLLPGCGQSGLPKMVPIRGVVTLDGKPLQSGTVLYLPDAPGGRQARGDIGPDGSYRLTTLRAGDGAQEGRYRIVIIAYKPHPGEPKTREEVEAAGGMIEREFAVPRKYTEAETSGLKDQVHRSHSGVKNLELTP